MLDGLGLNAYSIITYILVCIGLWKIFEKCKINKWYALVPFYRLYKIAEFVDMEDDGSTYVVLMLFQYVSSGIIYALENFLGGHEHTRIFLRLISLIVYIAVIVYKLRIYFEFARNFKRRRIWAFLWLVVDFFPALLWGFSKKYQPHLSESISAAGESGYVAASLEHGLTVNIKERKVRVGLKTRYLLKDIHMTIAPGKMVLLLGGSGAGKTTLLNAINGYEKANAEILLDGENVYTHYNKLKYKIGFVPQQDLIRYEDTVEKTLNDAAKLRLPTNVGINERKRRVDEVLDLFGLVSVRENMVSKQSGGQKKRISIATEFISDPDLFILDEPDSGLDGILARELMQRLHDISRKGKIVVVITHTPDRIIDLFDEVIVLAKDANCTGRLVFHGSVEDARAFFNAEKMESIVKCINRSEEGGDGMADELIEKYAEVCNGTK